MTSTNPSNNTSAVTAAQGQDTKEVHMQHNIESLLQNLREKDTLLAESVEALIAEKDALLVEKHEQLSVALANNNHTPTHTLADSTEDGSEADAPVLKAKIRTNEEVRLIRQMTQRGGSEWKGLSYDAPEDEDGTVSEDNGHGSRTPWYDPPIQRQRWDEDQILPHVNWGDIFFDLFYVGAAYNLGMLIKDTAQEQGEQLLRGFIYFFGSLGPLWTCWEVQTFYQSRYVTNDYFHRFLDIVRYFCVGIAIYNIDPLNYYADKDSPDVLEFTLAMLVELMIAMGLCLELYFKGLGDRESIKNHTLDDFKFRNATLFVFYLAAFIIAAVNYAQARKGGSGEDLIAVDEYGTEYWASDASDAHGNVAAGHDTADLHAVVDSHALEEAQHEAAAATGEESGGHRLLSSSSSHGEGLFVGRGIWDIYDLPMTLTAVAYFLRFFMTSMRFFLRDMKGDIRSWYIPTNIDYLIHRYGEFIMLMIGEGVLSLLIIETVETHDYFVTVVCGFLTMIFVHVLKTESEPHDSSKHALMRCRFSALWYSAFVQTLTIGLIGFGVCYKSFLHDIFDHAILTGRDWETDETIPDYYFAVAKGFSAFLTIVVLSLELMNATHRDMKESIGLLFQSKEGKKSLNWPVVIVTLLKVGIVLFCVTLFVWLTLPDDLAIAGLCVVFALSVTRVLNHILINEKEMVEEVTERAVNIAKRAGNIAADGAKRSGSIARDGIDKGLGVVRGERKSFSQDDEERAE